MLQCGHKLIAELVTPNGLSAAARPRRIARLRHESLDHAMEYVPVVIPVLAMHAKVLHRLRTLPAEQLQVDIPLGRVDHRIVEDLLHFYGRETEIEISCR